MACLLAGGALAFDPGGWQTFGPLKWTVITVAAWISVAAVVRRGLIVHRFSFVAWGAFLAWAAFTSVVALDPLSAWLGTPDRRMGMIGLSTMAAAFVAGQGVTDVAGRRVIGRATAVALLGMTIYGVAEASGRAPVELTSTSSRLGSTFGSAAYLGAGICLLAPIAVGLAADRRETTMWRLLGGSASVGATFLLAGSATRAALVGLMAGLAVTLPIWWRQLPRQPLLIGTSVAVVIAVLVFAPGSRRLLQPDFEGRLAEWRTATSVLAAHPVSGTGLEGYRIAFPQHVDVDYVRAYGRDTVTDRAHSGPLDMGVAVGVVGLAAWILAGVWMARRAWGTGRLGDPLLVGMGAGVVTLFAQELFLFPTLEVGVAAWAVAGMVVAAHPVSGRLEVGSRSLAAVAFLVAGGAVILGVADVTADHLASAARRGTDVATAERAASLRPDSFRYPLLAADLATRAHSPAVALASIDDALRLSPSDPALRLARGRVVTSLVAEGRWDPERGADELGRLVNRDPNHPELRLLHGDLLAAAGSSGEAERAWLAAAYLSPSQATADLRLASLYLSLGQEGLAREALERARERDADHPQIGRLERVLEDV